jgi:hypothetical protein
MFRCKLTSLRSLAIRSQNSDLRPDWRHERSGAKLNKVSSIITENKGHAGARAMRKQLTVTKPLKPEDGPTNLVYAVGLNDDDFAKPQIGISPMWWEGMLATDQSSALLW